MKIIKKILSISLLLIILTSLFYNSKAFEFGTKEVKLSSWCNDYFTYDGALVHVPYITCGNDNMLAYCVDPNIPGIGSGGVTSYNVVVNGKITNETLWKVLINCYPYKSLSELGVASVEEAYYASDVAIMVILGTRNHASYAANTSESGSERVYNAYLKILESTNSETRKFSSNTQISITAQNDWQIENDYLSKTYLATSDIDGTATLTLSGNLPSGSKMVNSNEEEIQEINLGETFKIQVPVDKIDEVYDFSIQATATLKTYPIYYAKTTISGKQSYGLVGETYETITSSISDKTVKNSTKIVVIKKEYGSEKRLAGVKFNLLDSNKSIIYQDLVTDDSGEIELSKILPGTYFLQEVETLDGYNIYEDLIEVNISLNEEVEVIVNNTVKTVNEVSKEKENIEVVETQSQTVYKNSVAQSSIQKLPVTGY